MTMVLAVVHPTLSRAVMATGLQGASAILGNSFLSHFVVKLDQKAGQLHLIELEGDKKPTGTVQVIGDKSAK